MKINNGNGLPEAGFYEMKQDVYDIAWRINAMEFHLALRKRIRGKT